MALILLIAVSCKKDDNTSTNNPQPALTGGKGGNYSIVVFSKKNDTGIVARIFMKYAADKAPSDTAAYDEKYTSVAEPGYGPHAHFNSLTAGTYYIIAQAGTAKEDTGITITNGQTTETDIDLQLK
jgi:hypothetical protein